MDFDAALRVAVQALSSEDGDAPPRTLVPSQLEVAYLDRTQPGRAFQRVSSESLAGILAV
jgi:hypothetical protein